jgi:hypothetical protein
MPFSLALQKRGKKNWDNFFPIFFLKKWDKKSFPIFFKVGHRSPKPGKETPVWGGLICWTTPKTPVWGPKNPGLGWSHLWSSGRPGPGTDRPRWAHLCKPDKKRVNSLTLVCSLSSYRHSYVGLRGNEPFFTLANFSSINLVSIFRYSSHESTTNPVYERRDI